jgi:TolB-like protein/DNA-binding winged helix-turn-helix (wHTH) protein
VSGGCAPADEYEASVIFTVGACQIDTDRLELRKNGENVPVEPQVFDLLVLLIENRDRIVTKDEIVERVWKGRVVSDAAISSRIKSARRALGDDGKAQSLIRTIHRRGIRFAGPVVEDKTGRAGQPTEDNANTANTATNPLITPIGHDVRKPPGSMELLVPDPSIASCDGDDNIAGLDFSLPKRPSVAVLPFEKLTADDDGQVICDGLSLDIMTRLARTRWLFVISRGTAFALRGLHQDPRDISRKLGVRYVVQGSVYLNGARMRVHAALTDAVRRHEVWADEFDSNVDNIFELQDQIADQIVAGIETEIEHSERRRALLTHPSSLDAWSAYHRATWHMYQFTPEGYEEAERLFKLAATLDPTTPRVFAGLSFVHWQRAFLEIGRDREGEMRQAFECAQHALRLDPREPLGHWALGRTSLLRNDLDHAIQQIAESVRLNPNFARGHYSLAFAQMINADFEESESAVLLARRLSPYDQMTFAMLAAQAFVATVRGRTDEGANLADLAVRQPNAHYHILAIASFCNASAGRLKVARGYVARLKSIHPGYRISDYFRAFPYREPGLLKRLRGVFLGLGLEE